MARGDDDPPELDDDAPVDPDDDLVDATDDGEPVTLDALRRFLNSAAVYERARRVVRRKVPRQDVDDVVGNAVTDALRASRLPSELRRQPWFDRVCRRAVARHFRKKASQARFQGNMPVAPVRTDEAGLPVDDPYADDIADLDPSLDPEVETPHARSFLFRRFMLEQTANDPDERATFEMMCEHFDDEKTYEQIARERKIPAGTLHARVHRLQRKYGERYVQYRNRMLPLLWLGGIVVAGVVVVVVAVLWGLLHRPPKIERIDPEPPSPPPSASAYDPRLDIAAPPSATASVPVPPLPSPPPRAPGPKAPVPRLKP
jgi:DNA-directed RNA polymerase specialized sigma24 family protein